MSVDPMAHMYNYFSPYLAFGDNPILFTDPQGETLRVAITSNTDFNSDARDDIKSLLPDENRNFDDVITIADDGLVSFKITKEKAKAMAEKDPGIELLYNLIYAHATIVYEVNTESTALENGKPVKKELFNPIQASVKDEDGKPFAQHFQIDNISCKSNEKSTLVDRYSMEEGVDGKVVIDPFLAWVGNEDNSGNKKNREAIVFHELAENYYRTEKEKNYDAAHAAAVDLQNKLHPKDRRRDGKSVEASMLAEDNIKTKNDGPNQKSIEKPVKK